MIVSEARIAANRRNGSLGKGPTSERGKQESRKNSFIHGLSGRGVVTAEGVAERIAARVEALAAELRPRTAAGLAMLDQLATNSIRMEIASEHETAAIAYNVRNAIDRFDEARIEAAEALFATLGDRPRSVLRKLRRSPEGVEKLIEAWEDLRNDLIVDAWGTEQLELAANLLGLRARHATGTELGALSLAIRGDFSALKGDEGADLAHEAREAWASARLGETIDAEIAELEAHYETLDFESIDLDRSEAPGRALFDDSKPACLARRYESEASRRFFRALREFHAVEAAYEPQPESVPIPAPAPAPAPTHAGPSNRMGSFRPMPPADEIPSTNTNSNGVMPDFSSRRGSENHPTLPVSKVGGVL